MTSTEQPLYYAEGRNIHKRPIKTKVDGGMSITLGFRAAAATQEVGEEGARVIAELMNRGDKFDALVEALRKAESALASCYQVADFPADGSTKQDSALSAVRAAISAATGTGA